MTKNTRLKIGLVVDDGLDRLDGVQKFVVTIGEYFKSKGHDVHYLAGETKRNDLGNIHSLSKNIKVVFNGGNQLSIPLPSSNKALKNLLDKEQFDVLHVQMPYSPFMAGKLIRYASPNTVVVGTFHILPYSKLQYFGSKLLGMVQQRTLNRFNYFFSVSLPAQIFARKTFGIESRVLPNPVDISAFKPKLPRKKSKHIKIVYLNRLVKRKGCFELLKALVQIEDKKLCKSDYTLDILSDGSLRPKLEKYVQSNNLTNKIKFRGYVSDQAKAEYLNDADIAVFPSLGGESFGIVLVEAMAAGAGAVIAGDNPGYRSVINDDSLLFDPRDTDSFAKFLASLIDNDGLRKKIFIAQQSKVSKYDLNTIGDELIATYLSCKK